MPTPNRSSVSPSPSLNRKGTTPSRNAGIFEGLSANSPDPSVWLPEQRQQFMQALMNASSSPLPASSPIGEPSMPVDPSLPPIDNPFAALLAAQAGGGSGVSPPFGPGMTGKAPIINNDVPEPTKFQKVMPLLHILAMWCLLAYFVLWAEPHMYSVVNSEDDRGTVGLWRRWAELGQHSPFLGSITQAFRIQVLVRFPTILSLSLNKLTRNIAAFFLGLYHSPDSSTFTAHIFWFCKSLLTHLECFIYLSSCLEFCSASDASRSGSTTFATTSSVHNCQFSQVYANGITVFRRPCRLDCRNWVHRLFLRLVRTVIIAV